MSRFRFLVDTNVIVDYLANREPFFDDARILMLCGRIGEFELWVTSSQITDVMYLLTEGGRSSLVPQTLAQLRSLRTFVEVHAVDACEVDRMLSTDWCDPEDALLYESALALDVDAIVTRDPSGFEGSLIKALDCSQLFDWLEGEFGLVYGEVGI